MRKKDTLEVYRDGKDFRLRILTPKGDVIMESKKTYVNKANARAAAKAFATRHDKFSFDIKITSAVSPCFKNTIGRL